MEQTVHVKGTRAKVVKLIRSLVGSSHGLAQHGDVMQQVLLRIGHAALFRIREGFTIRTRGGTDETGLKWQPLKKSTVAYNRRHPGVLFPGSKRAPFAPSWMLTKKQRELWWEIYRSYGGRRKAGAAYHAATRPNAPINLGHANAAIMAWRILKSKGAKTLIGEYGDAPHEILGSTGGLFMSLSPGQAGNVLTPERNAILVGTNYPFASAHHNGTRRIPQRRLWPEPRNWTAVWWTDMLGELRDGIMEIAVDLLRGA